MMVTFAANELSKMFEAATVGRAGTALATPGRRVVSAVPARRVADDGNLCSGGVIENVSESRVGTRRDCAGYTGTQSS